MLRRAGGAEEIHDTLITDGVSTVSAPIDGPIDRTFTFPDPDGWSITLHSRD